MAEIILVIAILSLSVLLLKDWRKTGTDSGKRESTSRKDAPEGIVGKSTFVLTADKRSVPKSDSSGKMDIEVLLEYEPDISAIEEQEELEQLGLSTEFSSDITFEDMMEVVNEVEIVRPQNPIKTGKLLYENENSEWVEQIASSSSDYQKRIVELIDLHLGKLGQNESATMEDDGVSEFDIGEYC
tara:strand:- start:5086 stop:5640 length:555 start_codon:yes stop_codon:yes gene_type:complete